MSSNNQHIIIMNNQVRQLTVRSVCGHTSVARPHNILFSSNYCKLSMMKIMLCFTK